MLGVLLWQGACRRLAREWTGPGEALRNDVFDTMGRRQVE